MDADVLWDDVTARLEAYLAAWQGDGPPSLETFLPAASAPSRPITLLELIKVDLEQRWQREVPRPSLSDYVAAYPELGALDQLPAELIAEEVLVRRRYDRDFQMSQFLESFPCQADEVHDFLQLAVSQTSPTGVPRRAPVGFASGDQLDDFTLLTPLGKGAFASVFLAQQRSMQRLVALKISADRGREPQTLARLDHPHIVRVFDQRVLPERGLRLLYMQYVPGGTLQTLLQGMREFPRSAWSGRLLLQCLDQTLAERGLSPPHDSRWRMQIVTMSWSDAVCRLAESLADALGYAHRQGVLHRDLKPANILISDAASPKLVDFNVSYCATTETAPDAYFGGSLAYMSPEQLEVCHPSHPSSAETLDGRSDLYSLGIVVWELLAGTRPFAEQFPDHGWTALLDELVSQRRAGISTDRLPPDIAPGVKQVIQRCLEPRPEDRFPDAETAADAWRMCRFEDVRRLWSPPTARWKSWAARWPITIVVLAVVMPHALASVLNYRFNWRTLDLPTADARQVFQRSILVLNAIVYPIGLAWGIAMVWPIARTVRSRVRHRPDQPADPETRQACLRLGRRLAVLGIVLWCLAGTVYPAAMAFRGMPLRGWDSFNFFGSLALCGTLGSVYPFFAATNIFLHVWYPTLVRPRGFSADDLPVWRWLDRMSLRYLCIAAAVPLYSVGALGLRGLTQDSRILLALSLGGLFLFVIVFRLCTGLQKNLAALMQYAADRGDSLS